MPLARDAKELAHQAMLKDTELDGGTGEKQSTPRGGPLPEWEGQVEITPEDVAEALRDWDAKAPRRFRGLLLTERQGKGG